MARMRASCGPFLPRSFFGGEEVDEILRRSIEQHDELLERRLERREQLRSELVLAGHRCELIFDARGVEQRAFDEPCLDLELLRGLPLLLLEGLDDLRS